MTAFSGRAADLPEGSVVASAHHAYISGGRDSYGGIWRNTFHGKGVVFGDDVIDDEIDNGAQVLRVGDSR